MTDQETCAAVERMSGEDCGAWMFAGTQLLPFALYENLTRDATI